MNRIRATAAFLCLRAAEHAEHAGCDMDPTSRGCFTLRTPSGSCSRSVSRDFGVGWIILIVCECPLGQEGLSVC